ncbi:mechanosensitive ion channel [bacterium]|nr:mechanosensitive ion channel [bacterium]
MNIVSFIESFFSNNLDLILQIFIHLAALKLFMVFTDKTSVNIKNRIYQNSENTSLLHMLLLVTKVIKVIIVICVIGSFLQCRGYSLTSLMTGLGITGLAIGFAAKEMLSSVLGSILIMTDKVYKIGDYVIINGVEGIVEAVNFRSTKIRTINNILITIPNNITSDTIVQNRSNSEFFRLIETFDIEYGTSDEKIQEALDILNDICEKDDDIQSGQIVMISGLGENSIKLQLIANTKTNYWMYYLEIKNRMFKTVLKRFRDSGINFAFPSRTLYMRNDEN